MQWKAINQSTGNITLVGGVLCKRSIKPAADSSYVYVLNE